MRGSQISDSRRTLVKVGDWPKTDGLQSMAVIRFMPKRSFNVVSNPLFEPV